MEITYLSVVIYMHNTHFWVIFYLKFDFKLALYIGI